MAKQAKQEEPLAPPKAKKLPPPKLVPNITPLIDVLFLLLLFFVLAGRVRQDEGFLPGSLPGTGDSGRVNQFLPPPMAVEVRGDGEYAARATYTISGQAAAFEDAGNLRKALEEQFRNVDSRAKDDAVVYIKYYSARWGFVVNAYNQAAAAGYKQISIQQGE